MLFITRDRTGIGSAVRKGFSGTKSSFCGGRKLDRKSGSDSESSVDQLDLRIASRTVKYLRASMDLDRFISISSDIDGFTGRSSFYKVQ